MMKPVQMLLCAGVGVLAGCAAPPSAPGSSEVAQSRGPQCFRVNEVYSYTQGADGFVQLQTASGPFQMHLDPGCPDMSWIMQIGIRPMDSSWLCEGKADELITPNPYANNRCFIGQIQPLGPGQTPA
jgi:hypothetical protein